MEQYIINHRDDANTEGDTLDSVMSSYRPTLVTTQQQRVERH